jgi:4-amino-4-deoxy-L-arabinose transferase-like glycosyltransferase
MKNIKLESHMSPRIMDLFCIGFIIALDPIAYFLSLSSGVFPPDTFAYATMARDLFSKGLLYLPSWGHVDQSLILPPLYPFLIACGRFLSSEPLNVAEFVSSSCILIFTIIIYFYMKKFTNRITAIITICVIQVNYYFFLIGMRPLSESVFLLTLGVTFWLISCFLDKTSKNQKVLSFFIGISCSLVFLSRQIGLIIYVFVGILFILRYLTESGNERKVLVNNLFLAICGAMLLFIPYASGIYLQTGQHPLKQYFRENRYLTKISDPKILSDIEQEKKVPPELLRSSAAQSDNAYSIIYAERRRMRRLLPDASEMYAYVSVQEKAKPNNVTDQISAYLKKPGVYFHSVYNNILNLKSALGGFTSAFFFLLCLLPLLSRPDNIRNLEGFLLPFFIIFYLLAISLITDKISRYVYILFPFCIMYIFITCYKYIKRIKSIPNFKLFRFLVYILISSLILITTPKFFTDLNLTIKNKGAENEYGSDFKKILNGEPVFSISAYEAYMVGSPYRILPNDSLDKVAAYGKKTGVRWLLIFRTRSNAGELRLYNNVDWYSIPQLEKAYPDLVEFHLGSINGSMVLYKIL